MNSLRVYMQCITTLHLIQTNDYYVSKHEMMSDISAVTWVMCVLLQVLYVDRDHSTRYQRLKLMVVKHPQPLQVN